MRPLRQPHMVKNLCNIGIFLLLNLMLVASFRLISVSPARSSAKTTFRSLTMGVKSMNAATFGQILKDADLREKYQIIDVREPEELTVARISGEDILNLPLSQAGSWTQQVTTGKLLDSSKPTVCLCHHGGRSMRVAMFLDIDAKFDEVYNMEGGINVYSKVVDPSIPTY